MKTAMAILFLMATVAYAQEDRHPACSNATLTGDYGFSVTGTRPSGPNLPIETIVGIAMTAVVDPPPVMVSSNGRRVVTLPVFVSLFR